MDYEYMVIEPTYKNKSEAAVHLNEQANLGWNFRGQILIDGEPHDTFERLKPVKEIRLPQISREVKAS